MTNRIDETTFTFVDAGGFNIFVRRWAPAAGDPAAAVQIAHGATEHSLRYERLARVLATEGYAVYANDHRGHGRTAATLAGAGIAGPNGWSGMVDGQKQLSEIARTEVVGRPLILIGHSMGSLLAQHYMQLWGRELDGVVLSGSFGRPLGDLDAAIAVLEALARGDAADQPSEAFTQMFAAFNGPFASAEATGFEWLSRDQAEVRKYVEDPWCGFPFSNGLVLELTKAQREIWRAENEARIPTELPVLVMSGAEDPVGDHTQSIRALVERYRAAGMTRITEHYYAGARHELFNETNRDEVHRDLLGWLEATTRAPH